ncbi:ribonuclease E inhibitor RraB [Haloechinothrix salitolerans]|uniref:Ribonuclease E inhibitor RraB n=2 Tax=Haloechinothrix salitolerans TaxID=926830 RepID=A0ABW2BZB7_9PSEU
MRWFRRRTAASRTFDTGHPGDDEVLSQLSKRSNLEAPRHWMHYLYCADEGSARQAESQIRSGGWAIQVVEPAAAGPGWVVIAEAHGVVMTPSAVRDARVFFEHVASSVSGGDYDGWEASL